MKMDARHSLCMDVSKQMAFVTHSESIRSNYREHFIMYRTAWISKHKKVYMKSNRARGGKAFAAFHKRIWFHSHWFIAAALVHWHHHPLWLNLHRPFVISACNQPDAVHKSHFILFTILFICWAKPRNHTRCQNLSSTYGIKLYKKSVHLLTKASRWRSQCRRNVCGIE